MQEPLVSICCITYNHVDYIRDCLDGFLMQKVDFPYEIIINDDCSTDGTIKIIEEYTRRFPLIIKPIFHEVNEYSKGTRGMFSNFVFPKAKGKYVALCEGDDYWTDPLKLQKQVDFLEDHSDYSFVCGGYIARDTINIKDEIIIDQKLKGLSDNDAGFEITITRIKNDWITKTLTLLFRRDCLDLNIINQYRHQRDVHFIYYLMKAGKGYYFKEVFGVYNIHSAGIHSGANNFARKKTRYLVYEELYLKSPSDYVKYKFFESTLHMLKFKIEDKNFSFPKTKLSLIKQAAKLASNKVEYIRIVEILIPRFKPLLRKLYI